VRNELWIHTAHIDTPLLILGSCSPLSQQLPTVAGAQLLISFNHFQQFSRRQLTR
jgi:hypothetical protein